MTPENKGEGSVVLGFETMVYVPVGEQGTLSARVAGEGCEEGGECNNGCECYCDCYACDKEAGGEIGQVRQQAANNRVSVGR